MPERASLDHYYGRKATGVDIAGEGWALQLEGDIAIVNEDPEQPKPPDEIVGQAFLTSILSESDTRLLFGSAQIQDEGAVTRYEVVLSPLGYHIADPAYPEEQRPQAPEVEQTHDPEKGDPIMQRIANDGIPVEGSQSPQEPQEAPDQGEE
jgi:hypothetical protein